jgi:hypothetical protein
MSGLLINHQSLQIRIISTMFTITSIFIRVILSITVALG